MSTPSIDLPNPRAEFVFYEPSETLAFVAAAIDTPGDLVRFLDRCRDVRLQEAAARAGGREIADVAADFPDLNIRLELKRHVRGVDAWPRNAAAATAWLLMFEIKAPGDISLMSPELARKMYGRPAFQIHVGPRRKEMGFKMFDKEGTVVPNFTLMDAPTADVEALVDGPDLIASLAAM